MGIDSISKINDAATQQLQQQTREAGELSKQRQQAAQAASGGKSSGAAVVQLRSGQGAGPPATGPSGLQTQGDAVPAEPV